MNTFWIVLTIFFGLAMTCLGYLYVVNFDEDSIKVRKPVHLLFDKMIVLLMAGSWVVSIVLMIYSIHFELATEMQLLLHFFTMAWLASIAILDHKYRVIPNQLVLIGFVFWVILALLQTFIAKVNIRVTAMYSGGGMLLFGGILWIIAAVAKGALGMGDVKMFSVLGLFYGITGTFVILFFTSIIMMVVAIVLLIAKKANRKSALPMAPFVVIGFIMSILLGI